MASHSQVCVDAELVEVNNAREKYGLAAGSLGIAELSSDSTLIVIGFFTTLASQRIALFVPEHRKVHIALIALSVTFLVFVTIRVLLNRLSVLMWRLSADYAVTNFRVLKFLCSLALVMTSSFLSGLLFSELGNLSWVEAFVFVLEGIIGIYVLLQLFHISADT